MNPPPLSTTRRIKRFVPLQLGKMLALLYSIVGLIFAPIFLLVSVLGARTTGQPLTGAAAIGGFVFIAFPLIYAVLGFIFGVLGAALYNLLAKWIGGIEVEVE